jgi:hypothetical protein
MSSSVTGLPGGSFAKRELPPLSANNSACLHHAQNLPAQNRRRLIDHSYLLVLNLRVLVKYVRKDVATRSPLRPSWAA